MYFNNRNRPGVSVYGCSSTMLIIGLVMLVLMIFGGLFFVLRYLGLIIVLGLVVWLFRKFVKKDPPQSSSRTEKRQSEKQSWSRDFESKETTSYDNFDREFEEVDEEEDFNDF